MAPELLDPPGFGMKDGNPTKECDIYAFGVVTYQVSRLCFILGAITEGSTQVITGKQPFPTANIGRVICNIVTGNRPTRPSGSNEWLLDDVWRLISRSWSPSWNDRPHAIFAMNVLVDAADAVEGSWEADLAVFLSVCMTGIEAKPEGNKAQEFVDRLDAVRHSDHESGRI